MRVIPLQAVRPVGGGGGGGGGEDGAEHAYLAQSRGWQ